MEKEIKLPSWTTEYCEDCGAFLPIEILHSNAGYYIGQFCHEMDGPYSRLSEEYYSSLEKAETALFTGTFTMRSHP